MPTCSEWFAARHAGRAPALVIGEVAQAHDGSLGLAHAFVDAIANAGASAVKFQTHIAQAESTPAEAWRVKFSQQDASRRDYWTRMEFSAEQWAGLKRHADQRGLLFLSSPFSHEAVDLLAGLGVEAWKVASGELSNSPMLDRMLELGVPMLLSTGMSPVSEIDGAIDRVRAKRVPFALLQCTSAYPCRPEDIGLNLLSAFRERYGCLVGLSDHSGTIFPTLAATVLGGSVFEVHVTMSREMFGPDVPASVTTTELRTLVEGVRFIEQMVQHEVDKDQMAARMAPLRDLFTKSVVARMPLSAGTVLEPRHLAIKKPGTGIPSTRLDAVIGQRLRRDLAADEIMRDQDLEQL